MCNVFCVTNRKLAGENFFGKLEKNASAGVSGIILREKDLDMASFEELAEQADKICKKYQVPLILHTYMDVAEKMGNGKVHLSYSAFDSMEELKKKKFGLIGVSVHSVEEARNAWKAGASYLIAGHIFETDCKKGLTPRGSSFLKEVCEAVEIPVYAIGGITPENAKVCLQAGAKGVCVMSSLMTSENPRELIEKYKK